jgi:hypothetical protein
VPDAGKTLEVFAGALYKGLLSVNGIDFAKPDPALKAQRVSMKKSANDANVYVCAVRYPKLILDDPETEFTMVAAVDKDKDIVKTNAVMARVNLKTGKVLSPPNATGHGQVSAWLAGVEHRPGLIDWVHSLAIRVTGSSCARDPRHRLGCRYSSGKLHVPPPHAPVDGHRDFCLPRRMIDDIIQNDELRTELADAQSMPVQAEVHPHISRIPAVIRVALHEHPR